MGAVRQESRREIASRILSGWGLDKPQREQLLNREENVIAVLSIYESLHTIFSEDEDRANSWPSKPNTAWNGASALDVMLAGDIERVRKHMKYHMYNV